MDKLKIGENDLQTIVTKINELIELYNKNCQAEIEKLKSENKVIRFQANFDYNRVFNMR